MYFCEDFNCNGKYLRFFGSNHSNNKDHIDYLKKKLNEFKPSLILVEGGYENANFDTEKDALDKGVEAGFTSFYAKSNNIKVIGNDPGYNRDISFLESFYNKKYIFLLYILRFSIYKPKDSNEDKIINFTKEMINKFKNISNWEGFDYSFENFKKIFLEVFNKEYDLKEDTTKYINPNLNISILNIISRKEDLYRDSYMFNKIMEEFRGHDRVFVVKGTHHLKQTEKFFEQLFE